MEKKIRKIASSEEEAKRLIIDAKKEAKQLSTELKEDVKWEVAISKNSQIPRPIHKRRIRKKRWFGKVANNIEAVIRLNGTLLSDPKRICRCGNNIDISDVADLECSGLSVSLKNLKDYLKWSKQWNRIHEAASNKKSLMDKFFEKYQKLFRHYERNKDWGSSTISHSFNVICPKCLIAIGKAEVTLRLINPPQLMSLERHELANLDVSREMWAYASKRMGFGSIEELKTWLDYKDAEQAKGVLQKAIAELNQLALPYETSKITGTLSSLIGEIDKEIRSRKREWVDAVEKIIKEQVVII